MAEESVNFGELLRKGREQRGLTLDQLARTTRVPEHVVQALEAGQLDELPPEVYAKGFIRAISRELGIPEAEPLARFALALAGQRQAAAVAPGGPMDPEALARNHTRTRTRRLLVGGAVLTAIVLLLVWALFRRS